MSYAKAFSASSLRLSSPEQRHKFFKALSPEELQFLAYDWDFWAREKQKEPDGDWRTWLILSGRGWGKTRVGSETLRKWKDRYGRLHIVGATSADARDVMIEGESGILAVSPPWDAPQYEPTKRRLTWNNGAQATVFSADEPDRLRGPQCEAAWADELAAWRYPEAWDQLMLGLRLGQDPRCIVTTTPRPTPIIVELAKRETTHLTRGTTFENRDNLAPAFFEQIIARYEGTRLGLQELYAEILEDVPGALWTRKTLENSRVDRYPELLRIVVAVDPPGTTAECGIIVAGKAADGHVYVIADVSRQGDPATWGRAVVDAYHLNWADAVVAEVNQGGKMVEHTIRTVPGTDDLRKGGIGVPYKAVRASRGKYSRAEPVSALYVQGQVHHVGYFPELEDQLCSWVPGDKSPDRLDALVYAVTELKLEAEPVSWEGVSPFYW